MELFPVLGVISISATVGGLFGGVLGAAIAPVIGLAIYAMTAKEVEEETER